MNYPTWAEARPMLFALRALSRTQYAAGSTLQFPDGYTGTVADGLLILSEGNDGPVIFMQPVEWPISKAQAAGPDPNQLTLDSPEATAAP